MNYWPDGWNDGWNDWSTYKMYAIWFYSTQWALTSLKWMHKISRWIQCIWNVQPAISGFLSSSLYDLHLQCASPQRIFTPQSTPVTPQWRLHPDQKKDIQEILQIFEWGVTCLIFDSVLQLVSEWKMGFISNGETCWAGKGRCLPRLQVQYNWLTFAEIISGGAVISFSFCTRENSHANHPWHPQKAFQPRTSLWGMCNESPSPPNHFEKSWKGLLKLKRNCKN